MIISDEDRVVLAAAEKILRGAGIQELRFYERHSDEDFPQPLAVRYVSKKHGVEYNCSLVAVIRDL